MVTSEREWALAQHMASLEERIELLNTRTGVTRELLDTMIEKVNGLRTWVEIVERAAGRFIDVVRSV